MKIKNVISNENKLLVALFECEHCTHEETRSGYEGQYFTERVIPMLMCSKCAKTGSDSVS